VSTKEVPELVGDALAASESSATHIQIIASAGAGKTETISQRVAKLVRDGVQPSEIVAFTFTVKAAEEIKERIRERVRKFAGQDAADKIGMMYVGTIHGYCLQMLQQQVPEYETYEMADENQLAAFAIRWDKELNLRQFDAGGNRLFEGMRTFLANVAVLENDLIALNQLPEDLSSFKDSVEKLYGLLDQHRMLTFGMQIGRAIEALQNPDTRERITSGLRHLIVDEYQDVNIAQEKLVQLLAKPIGSADLVVVGDDDQAIYQWRGSSVENITNFANRYEHVVTYRLLTNYRSRPGIVTLANAFSETIEGRLPKVMLPSKEANGPSVDIADDFEFEAHEAHDIAESIQRLVRSGYKYSDIAVLVRAGTTYPRLLDAFEKSGVPVAPGDRLGLLEQSDALFLARVFAFLADMDWKESKYAQAEAVSLATLITHARQLYDVVESALERFLITTKSKVGQDSRKIGLVDLLYELFSLLGVQNWAQDDNVAVGRLGTMAKFASMVGDYEGIQKHARLNEDGSQTGASDQKEWYFKGLVILMSQFARDSYRDFGGEADLTLDAVDLMTVHAAKGLEWPIVFIPSVTGKRFPSSRVGQGPNWIIPRDLFEADRYEGTLNDERRLFYVALTRAREWVSISSHEKVNTKRGSQSPFMEHLLEVFEDTPGYPPEWTRDREGEIDGVLQISYSDLSSYLNCGWSYWLRNRIGFPSVIVEELGYGKAVHHLMRVIAERSTEKGRPLSAREVDKILATDFFLPFANKTLAENLKNSASSLIHKYMDEYSEDTTRTWQTERPFELEVEGALIIGRADVILDKQDGVVNNLAIVDYKTAVGEQEFDLQLQIYAEAGTREGLTVRGAYVHDLRDASRAEVPIDVDSRKQAVAVAEKAVKGIKNREFEAKPSVPKCGRCDVRSICLSAAKKDNQNN
jgi:DNA helicase-2/ATP-dependent DNA helicase PcrA